MTEHRFNQDEIAPYTEEGNDAIVRMLRKTVNDLTDATLRLQDFDVQRKRDYTEVSRGLNTEVIPDGELTVTLEMEYKVDL